MMTTTPRPHARFALALALALVVLPAGVHAQPAAAPGGAPLARDRVQAAAAEYDAGRRAYMDGQYEQAAVHFENAWHDAPRAEALRNAIRARIEAKQLSRAATLAVQGERLYGEDATTMALVRSTLEDAAPKLHKVTLTCRPECDVAVDGRSLTSQSGTVFTWFVEPGAHEATVAWSEGRMTSLAIAGEAGTAQEQSVVAPPLPPRPVVEEPVQPARAKPLGPAIFLVGAGLTAAGIAATVISGLDAQNNPGPDAVRRDCVGLGEDCSTYQEGRSAQLRTNLLLGSTVGLGVATALIGVFFTEWSSSRQATTPPRMGQAGGQRSGARLTVGTWPGGALVGLAGAL